MALKVYEECLDLGTPRHSSTHHELIYACSKRSDWSRKAFELFQQLETYGMSIYPRAYTHLLISTSRTSDVNTALAIWKLMEEKGRMNPEYTPKSHSLAALLWTIAAAETKENKISKRPFTQTFEPTFLVNIATEAVDRFLTKNPPNSFILSSHLAVAASHKSRELAERIFWKDYKKYNIERHPNTFELMFGLYDHLQDWEPIPLLRMEMLNSRVKISHQAYRHLTRVSALTGHIQEAIQYIVEAKSNGIEFSPQDMRIIHLRVFEAQRWDLHAKLLKLIKWPESLHPNPMAVWRERAERVNDFMEQVYGKEAPKIAR